MTERYIDPNSGAAAQPGGYANGPVADAEDPEKDANNVTLPEDANSTPEDDDSEGLADQGVEELDDDLVRSAAYDHSIETQAGPDGPQPGAEVRNDSGQVGNAGGTGSDEAEDEAEDEEEDEEEYEEYEEYDPADYNVDDVVTYVEENPDERAAVVEAEKKGKNRSTLLTRLEG